jgi:hypothetical protein
MKQNANRQASLFHEIPGRPSDIPPLWRNVRCAPPQMAERFRETRKGYAAYLAGSLNLGGEYSQ